MDNSKKKTFAHIPGYWLWTFSVLYFAEAVGLDLGLHEGVFEAGVLMALAVLVWPQPAPKVEDEAGS